MCTWGQGITASHEGCIFPEPADGERTSGQIWDLCWNTHTLFLFLRTGDQAPCVSRSDLKHGHLLSLLHPPSCGLSCMLWRLKTYTFGVFAERLNRGRLRRMQWFRKWRHGERKTQQEINDAPESWAPVALPRSFLKCHSVAFSKGSITLGSEGHGFVCFFFLFCTYLISPLLYNTYLLNAYRMTALCWCRESKIELD